MRQGGPAAQAPEFACDRAKSQSIFLNRELGVKTAISGVNRRGLRSNTQDKRPPGR
jgi:hypothetical protein